MKEDFRPTGDRLRSEGPGLCNLSTCSVSERSKNGARQNPAGHKALLSQLTAAEELWRNSPAPTMVLKTLDYRLMTWPWKPARPLSTHWNKSMEELVLLWAESAATTEASFFVFFKGTWRSRRKLMRQAQKKRPVNGSLWQWPSMAKWRRAGGIFFSLACENGSPGVSVWSAAITDGQWATPAPPLYRMWSSRCTAGERR